MRYGASALIGLLTLPGCGADEPVVPQSPLVDVELEKTLYEHTPDVRSGIATGSFGKPAVEYEPIAVDARFSHLLAFQMKPMLPPTRTALPTSGPLILYSDALEVLVFSPLDHFFESVIDFREGQIRYGVAGEIDAIPAGFRHRFLLAHGSGVARTLGFWGEQLLAGRKRGPVDRYADAGTSYLGYWTDNGAAYYYAKEPGMNEAETLLGVKADADQRGIPLGYFQLDSWWYSKEQGDASGPGGVTLWEPQAEMFPEGLAAFDGALGGLPLVLHNRWFAKQNDYLPDFGFVEGEKMALPQGRALYDRLMTDARGWGAVTYEQDWLMTQMDGVPWLRDSVGHAASWMGSMNDAASDAGLTLQLCMPGAAHLMDSVDRPAVTTARTSIDYAAKISKESFWPQFHLANLLAASLHVPPFKDNFRSAEAWGAGEALVSVLSAGMVGPSDAIGDMDAGLLESTCRADGLLLKPDAPALPIDAMLLEHERPFTVATRSVRDDAGTWTYVAAFLLASEHPERSSADRIWATIAYDGQLLEDQFPFPAEVNDWYVDLERDLGITQPVVVYDWRKGTAAVAERSFEMAPIEHLYDHAYLVICPIQPNGLALIGEPAKLVTAADRRFSGIEATGDALQIALEGAAGETVTLRAYDANAARLLDPVTVTLGADGRGDVTVSR